MLPEYSIIESLPEHVALLASDLRANDLAEITAGGMTGHQAVDRCFRMSIMCRSAFVENDIAAMFGLHVVFLSDVGMPWLLTTPAVERRPLAFVRETKKIVAEMLEYKPQLVGYCDARYQQAHGLLRAVGFNIDDPEPFGLLQKPFVKFWI